MDLTTLLIGPLALIVRYLLILAAGALAKASIVLFDATTGTITIQVDDASKAVAALAALALALLWRSIAARLGGKT